MFALSRSSCSSRSPFFENRARPLPAFLYYCLPFEAPSSYCDRRPRELARACPCGCVASVGGVFWCGRGAKQGLPRCPAAAPPLRRLLRAGAGGNTSAPSSPRKVATDQDSCSAASAEQTLSPQNPDWGLAQERPANWSTALSGTGTTGPTPRRGSISKTSAPRSAPIVHLCQKLLSVDSETTMRVHDRRSPPARPLHQP